MKRFLFFSSITLIVVLRVEAQEGIYDTTSNVKSMRNSGTGGTGAGSRAGKLFDIAIGDFHGNLKELTKNEDNTFEKHYRIGDLSRMWGLGRETVRKLVKDDPGVIKISMGRKNAHTVYSIPVSAARRIHTRLLNVA